MNTTQSEPPKLTDAEARERMRLSSRWVRNAATRDEIMRCIELDLKDNARADYMAALARTKA
jgi:hypothetical protein